MTQGVASREQLEAGYSALFPPLLRAALRACLENARLTRDDGWPTLQSCLDFAATFGVPGAELAAFFGHLGYRERGRTVWIDAFQPGSRSWAIQRLLTDRQAAAFGFACAYRDAVLSEARH